MATHLIKQVWQAVAQLNPADVRALAEQSVLIGLHASSDVVYECMEDFLCPAELSRERRLHIFDHLFRAEEPNAPARFDIEVYEPGLPRPHGTFLFEPKHPHRLIHDILATRQNLHVPLARIFPPFRKPVIDQIIHTVSRENALFSLATALPNVVPNIVQLPLAVGEFASDTAVLTANQIRMGFLIAASSDRLVGYSQQSAQIGSILAGAFGWRAVARELVGKIPFGGGLLPKAAIAYAGTYVAGRVLERVYRDGYTMSRHERREAYEGAFETGKRVAREILDTLPISKKNGEPKA